MTDWDTKNVSQQKAGYKMLVTKGRLSRARFKHPEHHTQNDRQHEAADNWNMQTVSSKKEIKADQHKHKNQQLTNIGFHNNTPCLKKK